MEKLSEILQHVSPRDIVLRMVRDVEETGDMKKAAQMIATGEWIAIYATLGEQPKLVLGRIIGF